MAGIGTLTGTPSTMGEGNPPEELSNPLRLNTSFTDTPAQLDLAVACIHCTLSPPRSPVPGRAGLAKMTFPTAFLRVACTEPRTDGKGGRLRILIVSDAWHPQLNGVVRALSATRDRLSGMGHEVEVIGPAPFRSVPCPTYPEIRLALASPGRIGRLIERFAPDAVHLATEGPLGWCARRWLRRQGVPFTTSFHTMFPLYLKLRGGIPEPWSFALLRLFHNAGVRTMYSTATLRSTLDRHGFTDLAQWVRGVDTDLFRPVAPAKLGLEGPVLMYVGRLAVEKNLDAFLGLNVAGTKVLVGDGPQRAALEAQYPDAVFRGPRFGEELVAHYCAADVLVFPSRTDTLGLVMLEAAACGVPVAALPVPGPNDIVGNSGAGVLNDDLRAAIGAALAIEPQVCREHALRHTWDVSARQFLNNLEPVGLNQPAGAVRERGTA